MKILPHKKKARDFFPRFFILSENSSKNVLPAKIVAFACRPLYRGYCSLTNTVNNSFLQIGHCMQRRFIAVSLEATRMVVQGKMRVTPKYTRSLAEHSTMDLARFPVFAIRNFAVQTLHAAQFYCSPDSVCNITLLQRVPKPQESLCKVILQGCEKMQGDLRGAAAL